MRARFLPVGKKNRTQNKIKQKETKPVADGVCVYKSIIIWVYLLYNVRVIISLLLYLYCYVLLWRKAAYVCEVGPASAHRRCFFFFLIIFFHRISGGHPRFARNGDTKRVFYVPAVRTSCVWNTYFRYFLCAFIPVTITRNRSRFKE